MAKQVKLTKDGIQVYPETITNAIADINTGKRLSDVVLELYDFSLNWELVQDENNSQIFNLVDNNGEVHGSFTLPSASGIATGTYLSIDDSTGTSTINITFGNFSKPTSTGNGVAKVGDVKTYVANQISDAMANIGGDETVDVNEEGGRYVISTKVSLVTVNNPLKVAEDGLYVDSGNFATSAQGSLASTALQLVNVDDDTFINISEKSGSTQEISLTVQSMSGASASSQGLAEASDVKDFVNNAISALDTDKIVAESISDKVYEDYTNILFPASSDEGTESSND